MSCSLHRGQQLTDQTPARRLTVSLMQHGRNNGKKLMAVSTRSCALLPSRTCAGPSACVAARRSG